MDSFPLASATRVFFSVTRAEFSSIEVTFNPPTFCGFSNARERAATSGCGAGCGGEVRCDAAAAGGGGGVLSLGGCAAKHIEGCLVGVMKPQELLYAAVDYYIKKKRKKARF